MEKTRDIVEDSGQVSTTKVHQWLYTVSTVILQYTLGFCESKCEEVLGAFR